MAEWRPEKSWESKHDIKKTSFKKICCKSILQLLNMVSHEAPFQTWKATTFTFFKVVPVKILSDGISQAQSHYTWQKRENELWFSFSYIIWHQQKHTWTLYILSSQFMVFCLRLCLTKNFFLITFINLLSLSLSLSDTKSTSVSVCTLHYIPSYTCF